ncbi:MAG TPA: hypothetical protein VJA40_03030 [archaeon]|nr:hypothetical protein [archaeon]
MASALANSVTLALSVVGLVVVVGLYSYFAGRLLPLIQRSQGQARRYLESLFIVTSLLGVMHSLVFIWLFLLVTVDFFHISFWLDLAGLLLTIAVLVVAFEFIKVIKSSFEDFVVPDKEAVPKDFFGYS